MARTVLVTGGNRGIGLAIAQAFVKQGDRVAITHRGSGAPEGMFGAQCDITDGAAVDAAFATVEAELGPVEVLVANAGITDDTLLLRMTDEQFTRVLDTNLTGAYLVAQAALPLLGAGGSIVNIGSRVATVGIPLRAHYTAAKAGMIGLTRSLCKELGPRGIRVNLVAPGVIATEAELSDEVRARYEGMTALRRLGDTADVAAVVCFLASDLAAYITGETIHVDGGI